MSSRNALIFVISSALSAGVLMADQGAAARHRHGTREGFLDRVSTQLSLTDQQKQEAKTIFASEREAARSVREELRADRKAVRTAIESGKPAGEVQGLAAKEGPALAKLAGMRATAFAKFYAELTPAQQQKLASLHQGWRQKHEAKRQS
jgi:periplasmic protein CpxP/Spy